MKKYGEKMILKLAKRLQVKNLYEKGFSYTQISEITSSSLWFICKWIRRSSVLDKQRTGKPTKISRRAKNIILSKSLNKWTDQGGSSRNIAKILKQKGIDISRSTVQRYLFKTFGKPRRQKVENKLSIRNIRGRISFCQRMVALGFSPNRRGENLCKKLFFTDEKYFYLHHAPNKQNHKFRTYDISTIPPVLKVKFDSSQLVAWGISSLGITDICLNIFIFKNLLSQFS